MFRTRLIHSMKYFYVETFLSSNVKVNLSGLQVKDKIKDPLLNPEKHFIYLCLNFDLYISLSPQNDPDPNLQVL